jgi:hypothetical protein
MTSSAIASDANRSTVEERSWDLEDEAVWTGEQEGTVIPELKLRESRHWSYEYEALGVGPRGVNVDYWQCCGCGMGSKETGVMVKAWPRVCQP